jgi:hypothetical protein
MFATAFDGQVCGVGASPFDPFHVKHFDHLCWATSNTVAFPSSQLSSCSPTAMDAPCGVRSPKCAASLPWCRHRVGGNTKKHQKTPRNTKKHTKTFIMPPFNGRCLVCLTDLDCNDLKKSELYEWYELVWVFHSCRHHVDFNKLNLEHRGQPWCPWRRIPQVRLDSHARL